jgi:hypothetical protein
MPKADPELDHIDVALQRVELAVPKRHPLTNIERLRLRDLNGWSVCLVSKVDTSHRFVGDIQPTLSEQIFNVAIAEREADAEPSAVPDNCRRELVAASETSSAILPTEPQSATVPVTEPSGLLHLFRKERR